ncbi:MAG: hypothetical protein IPJ37_11790 [Bacteroidales bacterium]|nr:hypothetical protein [Bacteroidales bacterium]
MRLRLFIFLAILSAPAWNSNITASVPKAVKGVMDLKVIDNPEKFIVKLNGDWEFYWGKILRPDDFSSGSVKPDYYGIVPSYWTDYPRTKLKLKNTDMPPTDLQFCFLMD